MRVVPTPRSEVARVPSGSAVTGEVAGLMPSFSEWERAAQRHRDQDVMTPDRLIAEHRRTAQIVALRMEDLERLDEWQTYAHHLDGLIAQVEAEVAICQATILSPEAVGDALAVAKGRAAYAAGRLDALRLAKALPDQLRQIGARYPLTASSQAV